MPRLSVEAPHALAQQEALRRLKEKISDAKNSYQSHVRDLRDEWNDRTLSFGFTAAGMKIAGTVSVDESNVRLDAQVPLAAMMFKGVIERRIREELGDLLA